MKGEAMRIYRSAHAEIPIPDISITELVFAGLAGREGAPALIDGATGRVMTGGRSASGSSGSRAGSRRAGSGPATCWR